MYPNLIWSELLFNKGFDVSLSLCVDFLDGDGVLFNELEILLYTGLLFVYSFLEEDWILTLLILISKNSRGGDE